jgi:hypothetical protein
MLVEKSEKKNLFLVDFIEKNTPCKAFVVGTVPMVCEIQPFTPKSSNYAPFERLCPIVIL